MKVTHKIPGIIELGIYRHSSKLWYVIDKITGATLGLPRETLGSAIEYGIQRAIDGGYK